MSSGFGVRGTVMKGWMLLVLSLATLACDPSEHAALIVAPKPAIRSDSAARAAFARSVFAAVERVAKQHGLVRNSQGGPYTHWSECLNEGGINLCGAERDSVVRIVFWEWARFSDTAVRVRREVFQNLQDQFGQQWVRECSVRRQGITCPTLAQIDSSR